MNSPGDLLRKIPEFSASSTLRVAPNTSVPVTKRLLRIIDSKAFQRLRKIRQLSLSDKVYPSATHTRFAHALGVYYNVLRYLKHLDAFPDFHMVYTEEDYLAIMLAGLLHDLGHYPCSHQLDHLPQFPAHEDLTIAIIEGDMLVDGENLADIISEDFGISPERISDYLGPPEALAPRQLLMKQLIDSPIDADKCDYLPRDSYFCGVDYATGFDKQRFIDHLIPAGDRLGIHEKGLMSAERLQLARYWMYRSVYWAHTVRALIVMLSKACEYITEDDFGPTWTQQLVTFNDHNFLDWLYDHLEDPGKELISMVHFERRPYKRLKTFSYHHDPENYRALQDPAPRERIFEALVNWARGHGLTLEPHHLIWDVPPIYKTNNWESFPIQLSSGARVPVAEESPVIDALAKAFLHGVRKIRLFCHPQLAALVKEERGNVPDIVSLI